MKNQEIDDIPMYEPMKCQHRNAYFVGSVGDEYCPDCGEWTSLCD